MSKNYKSPAELEKEVLRPFTYIFKAKSNHFVSKEMPEALNYWLNIPEGKLKEIQNVMECFVNFTLLFDDIQDNSLMRRNIPTAHQMFGVPLTINASIHSLLMVMKSVEELGHSEALKLFLNQLLTVMTGQGISIYWRENLILPTEEEYKWMSRKKTSGVFMLSLILMQLFSDDKRDYTKFINAFGNYYEIRDDYCNLIKQEALEGKSRVEELMKTNENSFCEDFTDGKLSFPVLHALQASSDSAPLIYALKGRTRDFEVKKHCLSILEELGSLQYTLDAIRSMDKELREEIARLGGNPKLEAILDNFYL